MNSLKTDRVCSKYKFFGGFGLLIGINVFLEFITFIFLKESKISYEKLDLFNDTNALFVYSVFGGLNILFLILFATQCKFIIADSDGITFINPIFPFLKRKRLWSEFEYYILVDEDSRYDSYEAVWLIKNRKIKERFSSFYYTNYNDLRNQINTKGLGKRYFNQFEQLFAILRIMKIKN